MAARERDTWFDMYPGRAATQSGLRQLTHVRAPSGADGLVSCRRPLFGWGHFFWSRSSRTEPPARRFSSATILSARGRNSASWALAYSIANLFFQQPVSVNLSAPAKPNSQERPLRKQAECQCLPRYEGERHGHSIASAGLRAVPKSAPAPTTPTNSPLVPIQLPSIHF